MTMDPAPESESIEMRVELHPFLVGLPSDHIRLLADCAMAKHFEAGEYLFRRGEFANRFYLIEDGMVDLEALDNAGTSVAIEQVGPGKLVGWSWLFPPYIWHFDARAIEPTNALFFYGTILREYCAKDPSLGFELFKRMSLVMVERLQAARARLVTNHSHQRKAKSPPQ
jgi:CRP-like cAMP-binding protein